MQRTELIGGQEFTRPERTPFLRRVIDRAQMALQSELDSVALDVQVKRDADLLLSTHAALIPDLAVFDGPTSEIPRLVVEYRAESTDRLFFGPKRLAYTRARLPELWFVDAVNGTVTVLCLSGALDYRWPGRAYVMGEVIESSVWPNFALPASSLIPLKGIPKNDVR